LSWFFGALGVSGLAFAWLIGVELPKSDPGRWPIAIDRRHEEFRIETTLEAASEYRLEVLAETADPSDDPVFGVLELDWRKPGSDAAERVRPHAENGVNYFTTGKMRGLHVFKGRVKGWLPFVPKAEELTSVEVVLRGGPRPITAWIAIGLFFAGFFAATLVFVWGSISAMRAMSEKRRLQGGLKT
jgi:hypothetical protein